MINFQTALDKSPTSTLVVSVPTVTVTTRRPEGKANEKRTHLVSTSDTWTWQQLRDYVVEQIEARSGKFPRNLAAEAGIFKRFMGKYEDGMAARIARFAFDNCDGMWKGSPVGITRFCKNSDPYFGDPIQDRLNRT